MNSDQRGQQEALNPPKPAIARSSLPAAPPPAPGLLPWQHELVQAIRKLGPDEQLVVMMPRQSAHPIWSLIEKEG